MPDIVSTAIVVLIAIVSLLSYVLAWRATHGRSVVVRALVRAGVPVLLLAMPALIFLPMMRAEPPQRPAGKIDGQLSSQLAGDSDRSSTKQDEPGAPAPEPATPSDHSEPQPEPRMAEAAPPAAEQQTPAASAEKSAPPGASAEQPFAAPRFNPESSAHGPVATPSETPSQSAAAPDANTQMSQPRMVLPPQLPDQAPGGAMVEMQTAPLASGDAEHSAPAAAPPGDGAPADAGFATTTRPAETRPGEPRVASSTQLPGGSKDAWDVVPVFFGTDREEQPDPARLSFNAERGRRLELGRALITVPKSHQTPQVERPWALRIPYFDVTVYEQAEDPGRHFTMQEIKKLSKPEFLALVRERLGASKHFKDHALVFVHGYNTSFDHAAYRTAQIAYDLKFDGATFLYSWPSGGGVASYTYDRESAGASEPYLRQFLEMVVKESGAKSISVIGHSMGNQPLLDVLKDMKNAAPAGVVISQVILAAPDVDADNFINLALGIEGFAQGVTLYAAANDRALTISRNFWRNPRAGDVLATGPLIVPGMDTIDVTAASTDTFALNHSGYAENNVLLQDIGKLIESGLRPPDQRLSNLKRVTTDRGDYWRYMP
jgi:esterase/lipase superfamily enzyme